MLSTRVTKNMTIFPFIRNELSSQSREHVRRTRKETSIVERCLAEVINIFNREETVSIYNQLNHMSPPLENLPVYSCFDKGCPTKV